MGGVLELQQLPLLHLFQLEDDRVGLLGEVDARLVVHEEDEHEDKVGVWLEV